MSRKISWFLIALFFVALIARAAGAGLLDGKTFDGTTGEKGKTESKPDSLIFADGKFHSTGCDQYGFKPADYEATKKGDSITFEAAAASDKEGTIHWTGSITGDQVDAHSVWHKTGQKDIEYWFKGALKK